MSSRFRRPSLPADGEVLDVGVAFGPVRPGFLSGDFVESTGDYWRPFYYIPEAHGVPVWLVKANDVKQVPVRPKTDKLDAVWLAKLNERGMLRPSFVPPKPVRDIRDYTRLRHDLVADRTRYKLRLEKLLEDALIKLSTAAGSRGIADALTAAKP